MAGLDPATHARGATTGKLYPALLGCVRVTGLANGKGVGGRVKPGHDVRIVDPGAVDERSGNVHSTANIPSTTLQGPRRPATV